MRSQKYTSVLAALFDSFIALSFLFIRIVAFLTSEADFHSCKG